MSISFRVCLQVIFCTNLLIGTWSPRAHKNQFSYGMNCKKPFFTEIMLYEIQCQLRRFGGGLGNNLSDFCCPGNKLEN